MKSIKLAIVLLAAFSIKCAEQERTITVQNKTGVDIFLRAPIDYIGTFPDEPQGFALAPLYTKGKVYSGAIPIIPKNKTETVILNGVAGLSLRGTKVHYEAGNFFEVSEIAPFGESDYASSNHIPIEVGGSYVVTLDKQNKKIMVENVNPACCKNRKSGPRSDGTPCKHSDQCIGICSCKGLLKTNPITKECFGAGVCEQADKYCKGCID